MLEMMNQTLKSHLDPSMSPPLKISPHILFIHDTLCGAKREGVTKKSMLGVNLDTCCHHSWQTISPCPPLSSHLSISHMISHMVKL